MTRLRAILAQGLDATAAAWPTIRAGFGWVWRFASTLANEAGLDVLEVRRRYRVLIAELAHHDDFRGELAEAFGHFRKVTRSYWRGLFTCHGVADLPRTNNDLEQFFGSYRDHERRARGRKVACPGTVVRGSVRLIASAATRLGLVGVADLVPSDLAAWRRLRASLEQRQSLRALGRQFRKDSANYLKSLEDALIKDVLPP